MLIVRKINRDTEQAILYISEETTRTVYSLPLIDGNITNATPTPFVVGEQYPNSTSTSWKGIAEGPGQQLYVVEFSIFAGVPPDFPSLYSHIIFSTNASIQTL